MKTMNEFRAALQQVKTKSAWSRGVKEYANDLLNDLDAGIRNGWIDPGDTFSNYNMFDSALLNGAYDWKEFSYGGCSYIYDDEIAHRLCTKSELVKTRYGRRYPNKQETWLDVQARALYQASMLLWKIYKEV